MTVITCCLPKSKCFIYTLGKKNLETNRSGQVYNKRINLELFATMKKRIKWNLCKCEIAISSFYLIYLGIKTAIYL